MAVETTAEGASAENIGAINPYALAEYKLGRTVNWKRIAEPRKLLEETLGMPYEKLFDPREKSPLFAGKITKQNGKEVRSKPPVDVGGLVWADPGEFLRLSRRSPGRARTPSPSAPARPGQRSRSSST